MAALHVFFDYCEQRPIVDVEAAHDRAHLGDFFLILRRHVGHFNRPAAVGARRRHRRFQGLVNPFRARAARLPP